MTRARAASIGAGMAVSLALLQAQRPFRVYRPLEGADSDMGLPADYQAKTEFVVGRLMYPSGGGRGFRGGWGNWLEGGTTWTIDYPKGDRTFAAAIRRLTRVEVRSVEQPVNPDDGDDIYFWPYLHVAMPGTWNLTDSQAKKIRDYLLRGGFMLCDSYFGEAEWEGFTQGMKKIFPDREIEDLPDNDSIFHTIFDLDKRYQVGNYRSMIRDGRPYRAGGSIAYWRGLRDTKGRVVVAMAFNNDLGDSWQWADNPKYPEKYSALGLRIGVNYVVYAMTH